MEMTVIGLIEALRVEADRKFPGRFRPWMDQLLVGSWTSWAELLAYFPAAAQLDEKRGHFPLAPDGLGIEAMLNFPSESGRPGIIRLVRICPAPQAALPQTAGAAARRKISKPLVG
jgi:hypothetical protein